MTRKSILLLIKYKMSKSWYKLNKLVIKPYSINILRKKSVLTKNLVLSQLTSKKHKINPKTKFLVKINPGNS